MTATQNNLMANAIRVLSADAVQQANSGHPGAPLGMAEMAVALWGDALKHNPADPDWFDRDRFVLSNGHASMLLYSLLHLTGYDLPMSEIKNFRQMGSKTPGHPEVDVTPGVETTTGPLGQGLANAVGMALTEKMLAAEFNTATHTIVDHMTWVMMGDGCLMEGISQEVISLAGTLKLSKLVALYDDNGISIDGHVVDWFADDTPGRFRACGWQVIEVADGHDVSAISAAIASAKQQASLADGKPTLIVCKTVIGKGAKGMEGTHDVHGAPLGEAGVTALRQELGWTAAAFEMPEDVLTAWREPVQESTAYEDWQQTFASYAVAEPALASEFTRRMSGDLPEQFSEQWQQKLLELDKEATKVATRKSSQIALNALADLLPEFLGGSADLTGSNLTNFTGHQKITAAQAGNYLSYGVREFGMAAIMNGIALHGGYIPFGGTFLTFSDYSRNAIRMAALMKQRVIHVFTHDSIGLGEDGPTHQSVEHTASLRLIPNLDVWRPADTFETAMAWGGAVTRCSGPTALILSRQGLPVITHMDNAEDIARGGYILHDVAEPDVILIGTGSELHLAVEAQSVLAAKGINARVVSMPCTSAFDRQSAHYQQRVIANGIPVVAVEAGHRDGWYKYVGRSGAVIGINHFGESAPGPELMAHFGFTVENIVETAERLVG